MPSASFDNGEGKAREAARTGQGSADFLEMTANGRFGRAEGLFRQRGAWPLARYGALGAR
jgi:hypothetical protein